MQLLELALGWSVSEADLQLMEEHITAFQYGFEEFYVNAARDNSRCRLNTSKVHALWHLPQNIRDNGPMFAWWEWGLEDYIGHAVRWAKSKVFPAENVANALKVQELLKCAGMMFGDLDASIIWDTPRDPESENIALQRPEPKLPHGSVKIDTGHFLPAINDWHIAHNRFGHERHLLRDFLANAVQEELVASITLPEYGFVYNRYKIHENALHHRTTGHCVGSQRSQRGALDNRASHYIRYVNRPHAGGGLGPVTDLEMGFGEVIFFGKVRIPGVPRRRARNRGDDHNIDAEADLHDDDHFVAKILPWTVEYYDKPRFSVVFGHRRIRKERAGHAIFIDARLIDCCVGLLTTTTELLGEVDWIISPSPRPYANPLFDAVA